MALTPYQQLEQEFRKLHAFRGALSVLRWDAAVMMPRGSADVRGEQMAVLETEYHALLTAPKISRLVERALASTAQLEDWQIANLQRMKHQRDHAIATPVGLISRLAKATARAEVQWLEAREQKNFAAFAKHLEEVVKLVRDKAQLLAQALNLSPYDALLDGFSPTVTVDVIDDIFKGLGRRLPALIKEVLVEQAAHPALPPTGKFASGKQRS
ncbi:MAG: carboxypeptidase M32, partial [Steroidobacterales bacterium]